MKLIAQIKLLPSPYQAEALRQTIEQTNLACQFISDVAWETSTLRKYDLQRSCYKIVREQFDLTAQIVVRAIAKVADAYKLKRGERRTFKSTGSIAYDDRILSWRLNDSSVNIWTVAGRQRMPFVCGDRQRELLHTRQGESDLIMCQGMFFLAAVCDVEEPEPTDIEVVLGVDLGVVNIAADSDGQVFSGSQINNIRHRMRRLRSKLQSKGSRSARRKLKQLSGKEARFAKDTNHVISKRIVATAECTNRAIAVEKLTDIRSWTKVRGKEQRHRHANWSFYQMKQFIAYTACLIGVSLIEVYPKFTSQRCYACGHVAKANRRSQSEFVCCACGHTDLADRNAALNIVWAAVNQPIVSDALALVNAAPGTIRLL